MLYPEVNLHIAGAWVAADGRNGRPVTNPATGREVGQVPVATEADLDLAIDSSATAFASWRRLTAYDRAALLHRAAALLRERAPAVARVMVLEEGKIFSEALAEVRATADVFDWAAEEGRRAYGRIIPTRVSGMRQSVLFEPIGPAAAFCPWNAPALMPGRKVAEALAAGCTCIVKPAEETPATAMETLRCLVDAGLPAGVMNMVFGDPDMISRRLIGSPVIRKASFTGSTRVGKQLGALAGAEAKPITLELGGHAPVLIFADADLDQAVALSVAMKARNAGQLCGSPTRYYVEAPVYDRFVAAYVDRMAALRLGEGLGPESQMGPLANVRRLDAMEMLVADAQAHGARVACGGRRRGNEGYFFEPTVLTGADDAAAVMRQEPFGPISVMRPFEGFDEALRQANALPYGLAAYAFTRSAHMAHAFSEGVEAGLVGINTFNVIMPESPVSGVKDSGHGVEGGREGVASYLHPRHVAHLAS
jgi:succinate-semialdehyde dehydrogenase/glutarate-semialdehyde dehydrogenase